MGFCPSHDYTVFSLIYYSHVIVRMGLLGGAQASVALRFSKAHGKREASTFFA